MAQATGGQVMDIQAAIAEVSQAVNEAAGQIQQTLMHIDEIEVEFQTHVEKYVGGKIEIKVIGLGLSGQVGWERTNSVCITLAPKPVQTLAVGDFALELKMALELIIQGTTNLPQGIGAKGATVEITFVLGRSGGFEVIATGGGKSEETHIARLKLVA